MNVPETLLADQAWIPLIVLVTLLSLIIGFMIYRCNWVLKRMKKTHETNHIIVQKRIEAFDKIGPKLYDLISFFCYSGSWQEITPVDIMRLKKEMDKDISFNTLVFSQSLLEKYNGLNQLCFVSSTGWEHKEKIKSLYDLRKEHNTEWNEEWINLFDTKNVVDAITLRDRYNELLLSFKKDINMA